MEVFLSERTPPFTFLPAGMHMLWLELKQPLWTMKPCVQKGEATEREVETQYLSFSVWPIPLSIMSSRSIRIVPSIRISFLLKKNTYLGTSLVVQWLRLRSQCREPGFDPWTGN